MRGLWLVIALLIGGLVGGLARAEAPVLRVRARLRVDLSEVRRVAGGLVVRGLLVDVSREEPLPGRTVAIAVDGDHGFFRYAEPTGADGAFRWKVPLGDGKYTLRLMAGGDDEYDAAPLVERTLDVAKRTPTLTLEAPAEASVAGGSITIAVAAADPDGDELLQPASMGGAHAVSLPVSLLVDGREVARLHTGESPVEHELAVGSLGEAGARVQLTVRFAGDELRNPTQASRALKLTTPTRLTLAASAGELPYRGTVELSGQLSDAAGPVAGARVAVRAVKPDGAAGKELASAFTDGRGGFSATLTGGGERPGPLFLEARYQPEVSYREPARSPAVTLTVLAPGPRTLAFYLSPLATLLGLGGFTLWRRRTLAPFASARERRRARKAARAPRTQVGLTESRPTLLQAIRGASDLGLSGQVCELRTLDPVPTATVRLSSAALDRTLEVDHEGRFTVEELPPGPVSVEIAAPGFVPERFTRTLPHRGELRSVRVTLVPIRERVFDAYRRVALPLLPSPRLADTWTPRELLRHVERRVLIVDDLQALTSLVEEACFGPRPPDWSVLLEAERLADALSRPAA